MSNPKILQTHLSARAQVTQGHAVLAARAGVIFIALSIGAALRHYLTGEIPGGSHAIALTLWGWPIGAPLAALGLWITRPLT